QVVLLPRPPRQRPVRGRLVEGVVQPAVPVGRHLRGLGVAVVDYPATPAAVVAAGVAGLVIAVAHLVRPDEAAATADGEQGADGGAVPPGEDLAEHADIQGAEMGATIGFGPPRVQNVRRSTGPNILWVTGRPSTAFIDPSREAAYRRGQAARSEVGVRFQPW